MTVIVDIDHEGNNLNGYDSTQTDGGDLSVHKSAALAGTDYGLKLVIDDTNSIWVEKNISLSPDDDELRWRVFLDSSRLIRASFDWFRVRLSAHPNTGAYVRLASGGILVGKIILVIPVLVAVLIILTVFGWKPNGAPKVILLIGWCLVVFVVFRVVFYLVCIRVAAFGVNDDGTVVDTGWVLIISAEHCLEFHLERASSEGARDGRLRMWIDGRLKGTANNLDNYDLWSNIAALRMGAVGRVDVDTFGVLCLDELKANDDGSVIGCPVRPIWCIRRCLKLLWRQFFWIPSLIIRKRKMA